MAGSAGAELMETRVLILTPDQPSERLTVELPERPDYGSLRALLKNLLGPVEFEHVSVLADFECGLNFKRADMFVDEMGHQKGLPRNEAATIIHRRHALLHQHVKNAETLAWIAGPAVLFERIVWM